MLGKILIVFLVVNALFLAFYCRVQERIDEHAEKRRQSKALNMNQGLSLIHI